MKPTALLALRRSRSCWSSRNRSNRLWMSDAMLPELVDEPCDNVRGRLVNARSAKKDLRFSSSESDPRIEELPSEEYLPAGRLFTSRLFRRTTGSCCHPWPLERRRRATPCARFTRLTLGTESEKSRSTTGLVGGGSGRVDCAALSRPKFGFG